MKRNNTRGAGHENELLRVRVGVQIWIFYLDFEQHIFRHKSGVWIFIWIFRLELWGLDFEMDFPTPCLGFGFGFGLGTACIGYQSEPFLNSNFDQSLSQCWGEFLTMARRKFPLAPPALARVLFRSM